MFFAALVLDVLRKVVHVQQVLRDLLQRRHGLARPEVCVEDPVPVRMRGWQFLVTPLHNAYSDIYAR